LNSYQTVQETFPNAPARSSQRSPWILAATLIGATAAILALRPFQGKQWTDTFTAYFIAITLSATPYILLGAFLSGLMEVFLAPMTLVRITKRLGFWGVPVTAAVAPMFPVCECGIVTVVRGLLRKGLPLPHALTYLLAVPILNPVVLFSTYMAFQDARHPLCRALGGFLVSVVVGYAFSRAKPERVLLPGFCAVPDESHDCAHSEISERERPPTRIASLIQHTRDEFLEMMPYFLMGVFIASAMKTFLSESVLSLAAAHPVWGPASMMGSAFVLSLCSEADAFPAASFTDFSLVSHMGFLVLGPMLDIKLLLMYRTVFKTWFIGVFALSIVAAVTGYLLLLEALI
jgi:uncharacterized membrane protein YraQ (UPF0718 family)